jgi:hypothetical protein
MLGYLIIFLLGVVLLVAIATVLVNVYLRNAVGRGPHKPYRRAERLLTQEESNLFAALVRACNSLGVVQCKVRLWDLLWIPKDTRKPEVWRNRVWHKYADFVVCRAGDLKPLAVVALNDQAAAARLDDLRMILKAAGIPMLGVDPAQSYDPGELRERITKLLAESPNVPAADIAAAQLAGA